MVYYDGQVLTNQVVYAAMGNWAIKQIKASPWFPFINTQTHVLNHVLTMLVAAVAAVGINYSYSYTPTDGVLAITITGLTLAGIWHAAQQWFVSYVFQQTAYQVTKEKPTP